MNEQYLQRLLIWNKLMLGVFLVVLAGFAANAWLRSTIARSYALTASWTSKGDLSLSSFSDGPFVVTHLARYGKMESEKASASLSQPLAIVDSAGATIPNALMAKLVWVNFLGQPTAAPKPGENITVLYYRSQKAARTGERETP